MVLRSDGRIDGLSNLAVKPVPLAGSAKAKDELVPAMVGSVVTAHRSGVSGATAKLRQSQRPTWKLQETLPENSAV